MAYEFYTAGQAYQPEWAQSWTPSAFRKLMEEVGFKPGTMSASELRDGGDMNIRNKFYDYLNSQGMKLGLDSGGQYGKYQVFDKAGNPVGAGEDFNSGGMELLTPLLLAGGVAGLQALGGLGGGAAAAGEGVGTLGAGGTAAGGFTASPLTGLGASGGLTTGAAAIPTLGELGYGAGSLDALLGAGASVGAGAGAASGGTSATKAALYGDAGYGANAGSSGGLSSLVSGAKDLVSNPLVKYGLTGLGALAGAADAGKGQAATTSSQIDPRMAQYLYGSGYGDKNSLLGAAQDLWMQNKSGINPLMQQGLDMAKAALTDPAYAQAFNQMRSVGTGLLGTSVAGNPFTSGQASLGGLLSQAPRNTGIVPPNVNQGLPQMPIMPVKTGLI